MLKFTKDASGYSATNSQEFTIRIEKHCEYSYWTLAVYNEDYEEVADSYITGVKTKKELVQFANNAWG